MKYLQPDSASEIVWLLVCIRLSWASFIEYGSVERIEPVVWTSKIWECHEKEYPCIYAPNYARFEEPASNRKLDNET